MNLELKGTIKTIEDTIEGLNKQGQPWQKMTYTIDTGEQYDNIVAFEIFSQDKVEQFRKYNQVGDTVKVQFNVKCNEWKGKYFTTLSSWRCTKDSEQTPKNEVGATEEEVNDLPF